MSDWLKLGSVSTHNTTPPPGGVHVNVVVSPYDIPEAVRGVKTTSGSFRIEFRYIDGLEPEGKELQLDQHVKAVEGRFTGRLLALEVDVDAIGAQNVGVSISAPKLSAEQHDQLRERLDSAWNQVAAKYKSDDEKYVFTTARKALSTREEELLNQLAGT